MSGIMRDAGAGHAVASACAASRVRGRPPSRRPARERKVDARQCTRSADRAPTVLEGEGAPPTIPFSRERPAPARDREFPRRARLPR